jgi:hypothetical protein
MYNESRIVYTKERVMNRPGRRRLNIDLPTWLYVHYKQLSKDCQVTMTKLIMQELYRGVRTNHKKPEGQDKNLPLDTLKIKPRSKME